jgi:hypothetical protein
MRVERFTLVAGLRSDRRSSTFLAFINAFSDQRQHAIAFTDCLVEHSASRRTCLVEQRLIALSTVLPVAAVTIINDEVDAASGR